MFTIATLYFGLNQLWNLWMKPGNIFEASLHPPGDQLLPITSLACLGQGKTGAAVPGQITVREDEEGERASK